MNEGFVIMLFRGTVKVLTRSVLGWQPLGRQVTITAMDGNMVIKELDHIAVNFYEKYLKIDPSVDFDKKTLSFSLVVEKDGVELARLPMSCRKDGSSYSTSPSTLETSSAWHTATRMKSSMAAAES